MPSHALPTVDDVFAIHEDIVGHYDLPEGTSRPMPRTPIESAIEAAEEVDDDYRRAAALLRDIASAHVFEDGNERTAYAVSRTYLDAAGRDVAPSNAQRVVVMKHFKRFDLDELATWLRTGRIDEDRLRERYPD